MGLRAMDAPPWRINENVYGKRAVTADTALRLTRALGTKEQFWMELRADCEFEEARESPGNRLRKVENIAA
jgi:addiction module HigA family antidote